MLTVLEHRKGTKTRRPMTLCRCECGRDRLVRSDRLRRGEVIACATCARAESAKRGGLARRLPVDVALTRNIRGVYEINAARKGLPFHLDESQVGALIRAACAYCGLEAAPTNGIDRLDSELGYVLSNVVTACSTCNYAKREMSPSAFLAWAERIHAHQSVLQRDRQLLLRVVEQPDGCGAYHSRSDR